MALEKGYERIDRARPANRAMEFEGCVHKMRVLERGPDYKYLLDAKKAKKDCISCDGYDGKCAYYTYLNREFRREPRFWAINSPKEEFDFIKAGKKTVLGLIPTHEANYRAIIPTDIIRFKCIETGKELEKLARESFHSVDLVNFALRENKGDLFPGKDAAFCIKFYEAHPDYHLIEKNGIITVRLADIRKIKKSARLKDAPHEPRKSIL
jgi:hypothetical protein